TPPATTSAPAAAGVVVAPASCPRPAARRRSRRARARRAAAGGPGLAAPSRDEPLELIQELEQGVPSRAPVAGRQASLEGELPAHPEAAPAALDQPHQAVGAERRRRRELDDGPAGARLELLDPERPRTDPDRHD